MPTVRNFAIAGDAAWSATISTAGPHSGSITVKKGATWKYGTGGNASVVVGAVSGEGNLSWNGGMGTTIGGTFVIGGTTTGNATYICTNVSMSQPLDGISTYTVSGSRTVPASA